MPNNNNIIKYCLARGAWPGGGRQRGDTRKPLLTVTNEHHNNKTLKSSSVE